ncbi:MAG TPA: ribosome maturation factor [Chitinophagaceae bacterium]|nr:ribosome maturation factor [Chitinophagaceae bacterium]
MEGNIAQIEYLVKEMLEENPELFLVEVRIKPTNNVKVFIDGDRGVNVDQLVHYNRRVYRRLDELGLFPGGDFSLEVSSPGLEEPLKLHRQYLKNIGRYVEVTDTEGVRREGKLLSVDEGGIVLEEETGQGKKKEVKQSQLPFDRIKSTKIQIRIK